MEKEQKTGPAGEVKWGRGNGPHGKGKLEPLGARGPGRFSREREKKRGRKANQAGG